jgi:hypothetical protein
MAPNSAQAVQGRHGFAWVEQATWIEGRFDRMKLSELGGCELEAHFVQLFDADTVFARDRATDGDTQLENAAAELHRTLELGIVVGVEGDQRMQIAVAGMKDVGYRQIEFAGQRADALKHRRQLAARNRAVHAVVVGRDTAEGRKGGLATGPEAQALASSRDTRRSRAPTATSKSLTVAICAATVAALPSTSHSSMAAASSG